MVLVARRRWSQARINTPTLPYLSLNPCQAAMKMILRLVFFLFFLFLLFLFSRLVRILIFILFLRLLCLFCIFFSSFFPLQTKNCPTAGEKDITIAGRDFGPNPMVSVAGKPCLNTRFIASEGHRHHHHHHQSPPTFSLAQKNSH